jgi:peptidoglycan/xylan/chitin deacetylase (PgdA/CDA1 family)
MTEEDREWMFPGGRRKALTLGYDDGVLQDVRLIRMLRRYGLKGTFYINSGFLGRESIHRGVDHSCPKPEELREIYNGFEVAMHTCTHIKMAQASDDLLSQEVEEDRRTLEGLVGYEVCGLAYPCGSYNRHVVDKLRQMHVCYARVTEETEAFMFPDELLEWRATCRHTNPKWLEFAKRFLEPETEGLFFVWGHSYEFDINENWDEMERFCEMMSEREDIWYASNGEIAKWILGQRRKGQF